MRNHRSLAFSLVAFVLGGSLAVAQAPPTPAKPDTPAVKQHLDAARAAAGSEWTQAYDFICAANQTRANRPDDPEFEPTKIFDNLYAIGRLGTAVYAITTSDGIMLIDSGYADQLDTVLLPGMRKLGLDPERVKYVLLGHGHGDHFGGAAYFQERGARVALSAADWDLIENPPAPPPGRAGAPAAPAAAQPKPPKRDVVAVEGQPIVLGDMKVTPVSIPGHTPGSLGYIFPVKEGRATHTAALFGGSILTPGRIADAGLQQYVKSVEHFADVTRRMNVDVEIQNHPLYDGFDTRLQALKARKPGQPNPFVVGKEPHQKFLTVMRECIYAQLERRRT